MYVTIIKTGRFKIWQCKNWTIVRYRKKNWQSNLKEWNRKQKLSKYIVKILFLD